MSEEKESHIRSLAKGVTWRIIATFTIILIAYFTTGDVNMAITIGFWEFFIKLALYYTHERLWQQVPRGTIRKLVRAKSKLS